MILATLLLISSFQDALDQRPNKFNPKLMGTRGLMEFVESCKPTLKDYELTEKQKFIYCACMADAYQAHHDVLKSDAPTCSEGL